MLAATSAEVITGTPGRHWHRLDDGRVQCDVCPPTVQAARGPARPVLRARPAGRRRRAHHLRPLLRLLHRPDREEAAQPLPARHAGALLRHRRLQPGLQVLPELGHLARRARSTRLPRPARRPRRSPPRRCAPAAGRVAFTYNDPVIFLEYAVDVAEGLPRAGHQDRRRHRRLHLRRAAAGAVRPHGRRQRRPQGLHRGLLPRGSARGGWQPVLETLVYLQARDATSGSRSRPCSSPARTTPTPRSTALSDWFVDAPGPGGAVALHRVPSRLQDARHAAHPSADPARGAADRHGTGAAPRLHRQHSRPGRADEPAATPAVRS